MAELQIQPNVTSLPNGNGEIQLLYEAIDFETDSTGSTIISISILFNGQETLVETADISLVEGASLFSFGGDSTATDADNLDGNDETEQVRTLQITNIPVDFDGQQPLLTFSVETTDQFDNSVINFASGEPPAGVTISEISGVTLGEGGGGDEITVDLSIDPTAGSEADQTAFTLTATASEAVTGDQTVEVTTSGVDGDDFTEDLPTAITIADGQTTGEVTLTVTDDDVEEGEETATFAISNPSDGVVLGGTVEATAAIADNEDAPEPTEPTVELSVEPSEGTEEGETVFTFTATASEAVSGEQTVDLALSGDADAADFVGDLPTEIAIADGATTGTVQVTVADDDVEEGEETANFALENPPEGFVLGANTDVDITIEDNDSDAPPTELQGDFNDDGITNLDDLGLFAAAFGSAEGDANYNPAVELTGDNLINDDDLSPLATFFTQEFVVA